MVLTTLMLSFLMDALIADNSQKKHLQKKFRKSKKVNGLDVVYRSIHRTNMFEYISQNKNTSFFLFSH